MGILIIWCPSCKDNEIEIEEVKAEEPYIVTEYKISVENYKTCAECGGNLERK